jgi:hypothetical protein
MTTEQKIQAIQDAIDAQVAGFNGAAAGILIIESAQTALLKTYKRDYVRVNDTRYLSIEIARKGENVQTATVESLTFDENGKRNGALSFAQVKPSQWGAHDLIAFNVTVIDYIMGELTHDLVGKRALVEVKTPLVVFANKANVVFMVKTGPGQFTDGSETLKALCNLDTLGNVEAIKVALTAYLMSFVRRVLANSAPLMQRVGIYNKQETVYALYLRQSGRADKTMRDAAKALKS